MVRLGKLVRGGLAASQFLIASVVWASLREAMVLSGRTSLNMRFTVGKAKYP